MFVIIGLGNPGPEYERTRHNVGAWFVEMLAKTSWQQDSKYRVEKSKTMIGGEEVLLLKTTDYMNHSGQSIAPLLKYYKVTPEQVLVAHDELDLEPGTVKLKKGGGHAGHNGLRDIIRHFSADFLRLRIGIGHPGHKDLVSDFVLTKPKPDEKEGIDDALTRAVHTLPSIIAGELQSAMNDLH